MIDKYTHMVEVLLTVLSLYFVSFSFLHLQSSVNKYCVFKENKLKHFDGVIANPPFNLNDWGYEEAKKEDRFDRFRYGLPPKKNGVWAHSVFSGAKE